MCDCQLSVPPAATADRRDNQGDSIDDALVEPDLGPVGTDRSILEPSGGEYPWQARRSEVVKVELPVFGSEQRRRAALEQAISATKNGIVAVGNSDGEEAAGSENPVGFA